LTISAPSDTIYYPLDGSDPRLPGGDVLTGALVFDPGSPVTLDTSVHVKARAYSGGAWSALAEATFMQEVPLRVTEIMYNPPAPTTAEQALGFTDNKEFEYIELQNVGDETLDLEGIQFTEGVEFTFPAMTLQPSEYVLVVRNQAAFEARYGTALTIAGEFEGALDNAGEDIFVECAVGGEIHDFEYKNGWFDHTDGEGFSLVIRDPLQDTDLWDAKDGWRASWQEGGNPGAADTSPVDPGDIVINELLAHSDDPVTGDWIELHNTTDAPINIGGWFLSDDDTDNTTLASYEIAADTWIGANGYLVFTQVDHFGVGSGDTGSHIGFALSELGDDLYLTSQAPDGTPGGYREDEFFGASEGGVTFGRYIKPSGGKDFVPMVSSTMGGPNSGPVIPNVVINEIMYHPQDPGAPEWIELYNRSDADVGLYDVNHPENPWKFTDGIAFTFPAGAYVPAGGYALVVNDDPETFRSDYGIDASVPIYGPFEGGTRLANDGERIELSRPGDPEPDGFVPYIQTEKVNYEDGDPWPIRPDGSGPTLSRISPDEYGNNPANWVSSTVGGSPGALNYAAGSGTILREYWLDIGGNRIANLTGNSNYPYNPTGADEMSSFEAPVNFANNYGTRMRGYLHPPATGDYTFYIASDNDSELYLSTDEDPDNVVRICRVKESVGSRDWFNTDHPEQQSAPIHLEAGKYYYVEALHKEVDDDDHLSVAWQLPDGTLEGPIPFERLSPFVDVTVSIAATDEFAAEEGQDPGAFTISRVGNIDESLIVYYMVSGTASSADYTPALWGHVDIPAGQASATIVITPNDEEEEEPDETVILTLTANPNYLIDTAQATVTIADNDNLPPVVTGVVLNPDAGRTVRGVSEIEPSGIGVRTVRITFSKEVTFAAGDVLVQKVEFDAQGDETVIETVVPASVEGTGTTEMLITFADSWQQMIDTWVRITLSGTGTITDAAGNALDGEPKINSSGLGYIYDAALDLPSGDGLAGGDAVFYVGSLRGDFRGYGLGDEEPDGEITPWDITGFTQKYLSGNLDADMAGYGPGQAEPDDDVNPWDISGFTSRYSAAMASGTHLELLPTGGGEAMAAGATSPLPLAAAESSPSLTDSPETALLAEEPAHAAETEAPAAALPGETPPAAAATDDFTAGALVTSGAAAAPQSPAWSPETSGAAATASVLDGDGGMVDLLAVPALVVSLGA